jgi:hypothetical protein
MARSPFRKGARGRSAQSTKPHQYLPANDLASLQARKDQRQQLDLQSVSLQVRNSTTTRYFHKDFKFLVERHPHHEHLLRQLLAGATKDIGQRLVAFQTHQEAYLGIEDFIAFLNSDEPLHKPVRCVADLDVQVANGFRSWLIRLFPGRGVNRKRYGRVRSAVTTLQKKHSSSLDVGAAFPWPPGPKTTDMPSESYPTAVFNRLVEACLADIKWISKTMSGFASVVAQETPLQEVERSLENLMHDVVKIERATRASGQVKATHRKGFEWIIRRTEGVRRHIRENGMTMGQFLDLYRARGEELAARGRPTYGGRVSRYGLVDDHDRNMSARIAVATAANRYPEWPLHMDLASADRLLSQEWHLNTWDKESVDTRLYLAFSSIRVEPNGRVVEVGKMAYFSHFFFTFNTIFPFLLFVQLNTGWNLEAVLSLADHLDDHIEPDLLDEDYVIIYGSKHRTKSAVSHRSNVRSPYSVYRILRFVEAQVTRHKASPHYHPGQLWQAVLSKNLWNKVGRMVSPFNSKNWGVTSAAFLERHGIVVDPTKKKQTLEARRLRTTYETKRREQGLPIEAVSNLMGHGDVDTTDSHYDSDQASTELKNRRVRRLQAEFVADFRNYSARLAASATLTQLREAVSRAPDSKTRRDLLSKAAEELGIDDMDRVIHLISPEGQTYIAACADSLSPVWPGARDFVPAGQACRYFSRCCLCEQGVIFKEALPYVARRIKDLEALRLQVPAPEWLANYGDEMEAWEAVLNDWQPREDVAEARALAENGSVALPLTMRGADGRH